LGWVKYREIRIAGQEGLTDRHTGILSLSPEANTRPVVGKLDPDLAEKDFAFTLK